MFVVDATVHESVFQNCYFSRGRRSLKEGVNAPIVCILRVLGVCCMCAFCVVYVGGLCHCK